jgi:hypothetical protein
MIVIPITRPMAAEGREGLPAYWVRGKPVFAGRDREARNSPPFNREREAARRLRQRARDQATAAQ